MACLAQSGQRRADAVLLPAGGRHQIRDRSASLAPNQSLNRCLLARTMGWVGLPRAGHVGRRRRGRRPVRESRPCATDLRFTVAAALLARVFLVVFAAVLLFIVGISGWWTGHLGAVTTTSPTGHDGWG